MPDSFFTSSKSRKRKRSATSDDRASARRTKKPATSVGGSLRSRELSSRGKSTSGTKVDGKQKKKTSRKADEELSDQTDDEDGGGIEDLDLKIASGDDFVGDDDGEEDAGETPAEKRLRLAKLYLESVKEDLGQ